METGSQSTARLYETPNQIIEITSQVRKPLLLVRHPTEGAIGVALASDSSQIQETYPERQIVGMLPSLYPEWLGDRSFMETHGCRFPYVVGEMARGIATERMVVEAAKAGLMAFYGSAGQPISVIDKAIDTIRAALPQGTRWWGANLIHSPSAPQDESDVVDLFLRKEVRNVSASAFMALTPHVVRFAAKGLYRDRQGNIQRVNRIFAKISRPEVAIHFMSPSPDTMLRELVAKGHLTDAEATLAAQVPISQDITVESDSGGHTDNRPLGSLFPTIASIRDDAMQSHGHPIRLGAAGGIGTPTAAASAFALGAAYILTGSINQSAIESGLSEKGKQMLAQAGIADVTMAPAADMFEMGVKVQVLRRGTMFASRAQELYQLYRTYRSLDEIPTTTRNKIEKETFRASLESEWEQTRAYFQQVAPNEVIKAERDPKHLMALVFRRYLFLGAQWSREADASRAIDFQIWCGPAMGSFNSWAANSFLEAPEQRTVVQIALNLLEGAAVLTRAQQLRNAGAPVPSEAFTFRPRPLA